MSRFFPHPPYAEDQPLSRTILWSHTIYRGFQTGAFLGLTTHIVCQYIFRRPSSLLRLTGNGALISGAFLALVTPMRMWGREEIEWKDRSWRLLENERQMEVDDFSLVGTVLGVGALGVAVRRGKVPSATWREASGSAGAGSLAGTMAYMLYRYGYLGDDGK